MNPRCNDCTFDGECDHVRDENACLYKRPCALEQKPSLDPEDKTCGNCQNGNWHSGGMYSCAVSPVPSDSSKWNQSEAVCTNKKKDGSFAFRVKTVESEEEIRLMSKNFTREWHCRSCDRKDTCQIFN